MVYGETGAIQPEVDLLGGTRLRSARFVRLSVYFMFVLWRENSQWSSVLFPKSPSKSTLHSDTKWPLGTNPSCWWWRNIFAVRTEYDWLTTQSLFFFLSPFWLVPLLRWNKVVAFFFYDPTRQGKKLQLLHYGDFQGFNKWKIQRGFPSCSFSSPNFFRLDWILKLLQVLIFSSSFSGNLQCILHIYIISGLGRKCSSK